MAAAKGSTGALAASTAALGAAASLMGRSLAASTVQPEGGAARAVTPGVLFDIGTDLVETGQSLHLVQVEGGRARLARVASWDITGGPDPASWVYAATLHGPTRDEEVRAPREGVLHVTLGSDPGRPWKGRSPVPPETDRLAGGVEQTLANESDGPSAYLYPLPSTGREEEAPAKLIAEIRKADGGIVLQELAAFPGRGEALNPFGAVATRGGFSRFAQTRLGFDPPEAAVRLRRDVFRAVLAATGTPADLLDSGAEGSAQREAFRRFLHATVQPVAAIVEAALRDALSLPGLALDLRSLHAADVQGRARSWASLVGAGMAPSEAAQHVGFQNADS